MRPRADKVPGKRLVGKNRGMDLLWGDLHNHCGITYGTGSLENALRLARAQLDFCSVTPHALWPDMPERNEDTAFIVDFHNEGFDKIANNWLAYLDAIDAANRPGDFTTLFSFEMHSGAWGDHTFVSPSRELRIEMKNSPREIVEANGATPLIAIPHHIGYTPGYRGINWEGFDSAISPIVEVVSKHGCAMHEYSGHPYYHDMGPLDSRNTVFSGLDRGRRFSFAGSTDHHAGCPGSYGDGRIAVLAKENTREAIWEALLAGRAYAVTGCKIRCGFSVNGEVFGSGVPRGGAHVDYSVVAGGAIDRIIVYRNLTPVRIVEGLSLPAAGNRCKVRIEFGWGSNDDPYTWNVDASVSGGRLIDAEPCFRGRNMLAPEQKLRLAPDVNNLNMSVERIDEKGMSVVCDTFRNVSTLHPSTASVILEIEGDEDTVLDVGFNGIKTSSPIGRLLCSGFTGHVKPYSSNAFKVHAAVPDGRYRCKGSFFDESGGDFYHMEVVQRDGDRAFVSPVYMV